MRFVRPAGTCPHAVDVDRGRMSRNRAMRAGLTLLFIAVHSASVAQAETRVLWQMRFDVSLIPEVHPLRSHQILRLPVVLEEPAEAPASTLCPKAELARELLQTGEQGAGRAVHGRVTSRHLLRKEELKPPPVRVTNEVFGLVKTMPQAYAGIMFGVGWLLLLISVGLGYLGRRIEPYSADDPATWNADVSRPLAPLLIDADELHTAGAYPDRRL
ncbi:MAG: hypothetical protein IH602_04885 [Bryobacteraceae bacterium]|nr:hypothetical protein [Bryobacteraceae bacterium]